MNLKIGTSLQGGRYKIEKILGQGGFGITYLATQVMAGRKVCIKEYFPKDYYKREENSTTISLLSQSQSETMSRFRDKFVKEAQTIATLDYPHIIHIFDVFEENNTCYYVMEYIEGESLNSVIKRKGALDEAKAINYIRCIASALDHIHEQKINHLDVKPGNIMVRAKDDRVILIDFGLSKHYDNSGDQTSSTPIGISHGYAPMEQYQEGGVSSFSPATDIYSLGATLYYIVTGKVPPQATVVGEEGIGTLPEHLSPSTRKAIETAMSFWRKDRPKSIAEFLQILDSDTPTAVPTSNESWGIAEISDKQPKRTPRNNTGEMESADDAKTIITPAQSDDNKTHIEATKATPITPEVKRDNTSRVSKANNDKSSHNYSKVWWIIFILLTVGVVAMVVISKQGAIFDRDNSEYHTVTTQGFSGNGTLEKPYASRKYSDILTLPHELEGYFDLDEAIAAATAQNKPIFVDVTGHACNNCREMEASVWSNKKVMRYLEQDYIICALYVDDQTELDVDDIYIDANGELQTKLGNKNSAIAKERWGVTSQPGYVLVTPDGEAMLAPAPMGYEHDIEKFVAFLQTGLDNKAAGINYATAQNKPIFVDAGDNAYLNEEPYEIKGTVEDMIGDSEISWKVTSYRVEAGVYEIRFDGKISKGFHGYPMSDFSAPIFFVGDSEIAASEVSEPLKDQLVDMHGDMVYQGNVEYVFYVNGNSGEYLQGSVMATICSDKDNFCTQSDHSFVVRLQ